jgi:transposase
MPTHGWKCMKRTRRRYDRDFKISVLTELKAGEPLAQIAREYGIHPSLPCRWKAELERLLGQAHAETELLKKAFAMTQKKIREERLKPMLWDDI